jgi:hypothetical protein
LRPRRLAGVSRGPLNAGVRQHDTYIRYQLVLQIPGDSAAHYEALVALEDALVAALGDAADVDGHDIGSGEANIFVLTDNPQDTFAKALPILMSCADFDSMRAAFREVADDVYTVLWPRNFEGAFAIA